MLRTHYRQPMDWTVRGLEESFKTLQAMCEHPSFRSGGEAAFAPAVLDALCDDLNTPKVIAELHVIEREGNGAALGPTLRALGFLRPPESKRQVDESKVAALIDARVAARKAKNFKEADRIRDELTAMGIELEDKKEGTLWKVKR
jgi:cysteinyl-tRNA synthetase